MQSPLLLIINLLSTWNHQGFRTVQYDSLVGDHGGLVFTPAGYTNVETPLLSGQDTMICKLAILPVPSEETLKIRNSKGLRDNKF